ncbi:MAG: Maf family protein [Ruminococcus sp.]|jgi:septum formation protein|nr:Maf family protein [Ruminococcus sp.]
MGNIILASKSPRRNELLQFITKDFKIVPSEKEETIPKNIPLTDVAEYLATQKAKDIAEKFADDIVIGADTVVIIDNTILGKPKDEKDAFSMLKTLSGRVHEVITGVCIAKGGKFTSFPENTSVRFNDLSDREINEYIATKDPFDKAGSYGIQGRGALLVREIKGDFYNVMGLPVSKLNKILNLLQGSNL